MLNTISVRAPFASEDEMETVNDALETGFPSAHISVTMNTNAGRSRNATYILVSDSTSASMRATSDAELELINAWISVGKATWKYALAAARS